MEITVTIPDEIAHSIVREGHDPSRELLELAIPSALREGRIYESEAATLLGMSSRFELWHWLKQVAPDGGSDSIESVESELSAMDDKTMPRRETELSA